MPEPVLDARVPALVLKIGRYPLHHGGVGVVRSLGRAGVPVDVICEDRFTPAAMSRYARHRFIQRRGADDDASLVAGLVEIGRRADYRAVLVPTDDRAAILVDEHRDQLLPWFLIPGSPRGVARCLADKQSLQDLCARLGVGSPRSQVCATVAEFKQVAAATPLPFLVKVASPWALELHTSLPSTTLVRTDAELAEVSRRLSTTQPMRVLVQEYVPSPANGEWFVHGYSARDERRSIFFSGVKLRSYPQGAGITTWGRTEHNAAVIDIVRKVCRGTGYVGIVDVDFRLDARDGCFRLVDFNPRVGAQFRLFACRGGLDVVRALHLDLTGRALPADEPAPGRTFVVENFDALSLFRGSGDEGSRLRRWAAHVRESDERAWLAIDDPTPAGALVVRTALMLVRRGHRKEAA